MANPLYNIGVSHPNRGVRVILMGLLLHACLLRCLGLFKRELCVLVAVALVLHASCGFSPWVLLGLVLLSTQTWCWAKAARRVEFIAGHRAGAKGFTGVYVENTTEAMQALVQKDNGPEGPVPDLYYIEVDIQETADGQLVVLHDFHLGDAFPNTGPNIQPYKQLQAELGLKSQHDVVPLLLKRITFAQLHSLHLGGREGLHAPALRSFMAAFRAAECRRPLVVEVKGLQTDAAREELLHLLREHQQYAKHLVQQYPQFAHPHFGFLALIGFPNYYAASMGELGSKRWAYWASRLAALGIPVCCCFLEPLSYTRGVSAAT